MTVASSPESAARAESAAPQSVDFLLILRAFAGAVVVAVHVFTGLLSNHDSTGVLLRLGTLDVSFLLAGAGQAGVYLFFTLSGYLMGKGFVSGRYPATRRGALAFYWARFLRIYPLFVFYLVVMITLGRMNAATGAQTYGILAQLAAMQWRPEFGDPFPWFKHLWSIMTEVRFYLVVPLIALAFAGRPPSRRAAGALVGLALAAGCLARLVAWHRLQLGALPWSAVGARWDASIQQPIAMNLDAFVSGYLLNYALRTRPRTADGPRIASFAASLAAFYVAAAFVTYHALFVPNETMRDLWAIALPTATMAFGLYAIAFAERLNAGGLHASAPLRAAVRFAAHLGALTYGIYVWHLPFIALPLPFSRPFDLTGDIVASIATTYALAALLAQVTYAGLELPFDRFKRLVPARARTVGAEPHDPRRAAALPT